MHKVVVVIDADKDSGMADMITDAIYSIKGVIIVDSFPQYGLFNRHTDTAILYTDEETALENTDEDNAQFFTVQND
jgi:hypothetical protein